MLGKLIKHEFLSISKVLCPTYIVVLAVALLGRLTTWLATRKAIADAVSASFAKVLQYTASLLSVLFVVAFIVSIGMTIFFLIYRFYKNFFTDEGYLMLTLPTKAPQLILSKFSNSVVWVVIGLAVSVLSLIITFGHYDELIDDFKTLYNMMTHFGDAGYIRDSLGTDPKLFIAEVILLLVVGFCCFIMIWYFSIAFGQLLYKSHKVAGAIISFGVCQIVLLILFFVYMWFESSVLSGVIPGYLTSSGVAVQATMIGSTILNFLITVGLFFGTSFIMEHKLNLD